MDDSAAESELSARGGHPERHVYLAATALILQ
jgi:hypothetical protein